MIMKRKLSKKFGENMRRIRLEKGMSQGDISPKVGMDRASISNIENGKRNPTLANVEKIAKALGISADELLK